MKIQELGEFGLIDKIKKNAGRYKGHPEIVIGIGDDCAAIRYPGGNCLLYTTDTLVENVHFSKSYFTYYDIGFKALAVNLSDIAAMGGIPQYCLVTLGITDGTGVKDVEEIYRGLKTIASEFDVKIIGGDIVKSPCGLVVSVTLTGKTLSGNGIRRSGAKPGDTVFCTGNFGDSAAGFFALNKKLAGWDELKRRHTRPRPRVKEGLFIAKTGLANSMIDSSDGFDKSVRIICEESGVGCEIRLDKIPVSKTFENFSSGNRIDKNEYILSGGEEYELIFTASTENSGVFNKRFYPVGKITAKKDIVYTGPEGAIRDIGSGGFDHFAAKSKGKPQIYGGKRQRRR